MTVSKESQGENLLSLGLLCFGGEFHELAS